MSANKARFESGIALSTPIRLGVSAVAACFLSLPVLANPTNPTVVNGSATFQQVGNVLNVTNSNGAIINWNTFSIGAGETTRFIQANASSSVLNRVLANDPSLIYGTLTSNGRVWLINPAGIMVGAGGRVDVAGFVASTLAISNENFLAGKKLFDATPGAGSVVNQGTITTPSGGSVYLIAPNVSNEGIIRSPNGEVILAAGQTVNLIDSATPGVKVEITGAEGNATNLGEIVAEAGRIGMAGVLVRNSGTLNASSVVNEGGRIFLRATKAMALDETSDIRADGTKGGEVTAIVADAGGITGTLTARGRISAQGDGSQGSGGFVETSAGKVTIGSGFLVNTGGGQWLIDPHDYIIASTGGDIDGATLSLNLGSNDITILNTDGATGVNGDILVNDAVSWTSGHSLTLQADRNIDVNQPISATAGMVNLHSGTGGGITLNKPVSGYGVGLIGDSLTIGALGAVNSNSQIYIQRNSAGVVNLGDGASGGLVITSADFAKMTATNVVVASAMNSGTTVVGDIASAGTPLPYDFSIQAGNVSINSATTIYAGSHNASIWTNQLSTSPGSGVNAHAFDYVPLSVGANIVVQSSVCGAPNCIETGFLNNVSATSLNIGHFQASSIQFLDPLTTSASLGLTAAAISTANGASLAAGSAMTVKADSLSLGTGSNLSAGSISIAPLPSSSANMQIGGTDPGGLLFVDPTRLNATAALDLGSQHSLYSGTLTVAGNLNVPALNVSLHAGSAGSSGNIAINDAQISGAAVDVYAGGGISLLATTGPASVTSSGAMHVTAGGTLSLQGSNTTATYAMLNSAAGTQDITASSISLNAGSGGNYSYAWINANGDQHVTTTVGGIALTAGGGANFGNFASISHGTAGYGAMSGNQTFNVHGGAVTLAAGAASGTTTNAADYRLVPTAYCADFSSCSGGLGNPVTGAFAMFSSSLGNQSLTFANAGTLTLTGGSNGNRNVASIASGAAQSITGPVAIHLAGGASGGSNYQSSNGFSYLRNQANIFAPAGAQTLNVTSLDITSTGTDATGVGTAGLVGNGQTITLSGALTMHAGNTVTGNGSVYFRSFGTQSITTGAGGVTVQGGASGNGNSASINSSGNQTITAGYSGSWGPIAVTGGAAGADNYAKISSGGTQTLIGNSLYLYAGAAGHGNYALASSAGAQSIDVHFGGGSALYLQGGGTGGTDYDNYAIVGSTGGQSITLHGGSSTLNIVGGAGSSHLGAYSSECVSGCSGNSSNNKSGLINDTAGNQSIDFLGGGSLVMHGGSSGNGNSAFIHQAYTGGQQSITGAPQVSLTGGGSGGDVAATPWGAGSFLGNQAVIRADGTSQFIDAASVDLYGNPSAMVGSAVAGAAILATAGTQTVQSSSNIVVHGGHDDLMGYNDASGNSGATIFNFGSGGQTITATGYIRVYGSGQTGAPGNRATIASGGDQTISAGSDLTLQASDPSNGGYAAVWASGNQTITAGSLLLNAGTTGNDDFAQIRAGGNQLFNLNGGITMTGGGGGGNGNNDFASIEAGYVNASASQVFNFNALANVSLQGGSSGGTGGYTDSACGAACNGYSANSGAWIHNLGSGQQKLDFKAGATNQIHLTGGSGGGGNDASITTEGGPVWIGSSVSPTSYPSIWLSGGASGGTVIASGGHDYYMDNSANIGTDTGGSVTVLAKDLTMTGGTATFGGAFMGGGSTVDITVTNALSMTGGGSAPGSHLDSSGLHTLNEAYVHSAPAAIGDKNATNLTINAGSVSLLATTGETLDGGSPVLLGSLYGASNVTIIAASGITMTAGVTLPYGSNVMIGSRTLAGGSVVLNSGTGNLSLSQAYVGSGYGAGDSVTLIGNGGGLAQAMGGRIASRLLTANYGGVGTLGLQGSNEVDYVVLAAPSGDVNYRSNRSFHLISATAGAAPGVDVVTNPGTAGKVFIGSIATTGNRNVSVSADGGIYDDNGSGVINISTGSGNISLTSAGGVAGDLAISADTVTTGTLTATVSGGASGGIFVRNFSATSPATIALTDSASSHQMTKFYQDSALSLAGATFNAGTGDVIVGSSGTMSGIQTSRFWTVGPKPAKLVLTTDADMSLSGPLSLSTTDIGLGASSGILTIGSAVTGQNVALSGGTLNVNAAVTASGDLIAGAGTLNINAAMSAQDVILAANTLYVGPAGGVSATNQAASDIFAAVTGNATIDGGYLKTTNATNGDLQMIVGGNLTLINGGHIYAGYGQSGGGPFADASIAVGGILSLDNSSYIKSANDIYLDMLGSGSKIVLNNGSYVLSDISTGVVGTTHVTFALRSDGKGIFIDGTEDAAATVVGGSGFFAVDPGLYMPATDKASGLEVLYPSAVGSTVDPCVLNPVLCVIKAPTSQPGDQGGPQVDPKKGPDQTAGNDKEGSFGSDEDKDKDKDKNKQQGEGKKEEKPAQRRVAQCT